MADLLTSTYGSYVLNDLVIVRVASTNSAGTSDYAFNLDGAKVRTIPSKMNTPVI